MPVLARTHFVPNAAVVILWLVALVLFIVVLVDTVRRPQWQWQQAGSNKTMWIVVEILAFVLSPLFGVVSIVASIIYLAAARPKLVAAERAGQAGGYGSSWDPRGYPGPPGAYGSPPGPGGYGSPRPGEGPPGPYGEARYPGQQEWPAGPAEGQTTTPGAGSDDATRSAGQQGPPAYPGTSTQAPAHEWPVAQSQVPASWQPDPTRRHELRYWDGTQWTEHVADRGVQSTDPPA